MLKIPTHPRYHENLDRSGNRSDAAAPSLPCIVCGKGIVMAKARHWVHVFWGTDVVTPAEAHAIIQQGGEGGDMGCFPVGADCLRQHPEMREYVNREEAHATGRRESAD